jgi:hypothetical protein
MFRLLGQRAFIKAFPRPVSRLSNRIASPVIQNVRLPYTRPPSCDTIDRRFSSDNVDPHAYITAKRDQQAKDRGECVDIHDIGHDLQHYDVLITDIKGETLQGEIAENRRQANERTNERTTSLNRRQSNDMTKAEGFLTNPKKHLELQETSRTPTIVLSCLRVLIESSRMLDRARSLAARVQERNRFPTISFRSGECLNVNN